MWNTHGRPSLGRHKLAIFVCAALSSFSVIAPTRAGGLDSLETSLKLVPANTAFYSAMLRTGEQFRSFVNSKAFAKLKELPLVKMGLQHVDEQLKNPSDPQLAAVLQMLKQPENQQLIDVLADMVSSEVFFYGGESTIGMLELMAEAQGMGRLNKMLGRMAKGGFIGVDPNKAQVGALLESLSERAELIKVPDFVIGFRVSKPDAVEAQLKRLEAVLTALAAQAPPLAGRAKRQQVGGSSFLTITADAGMFPVDRIDLSEFETTEGEFKKLVDRIKELKLTVCLGVHNRYLLLAIGDSTGSVSKLIRKDKSLADQAELQVLAKHASERLTSINYVSKALRQRLAGSGDDLDKLISQGEEFLKNSGLPDDLQARIKKDAAELVKDIKSFAAETGASVGYSFLTARGQESFSYDWAAHPSMDSTKPLTLLNHVGGTPILAAVGRSKHQPEHYQTLVKWVKTANGYVEDLVVPRLDENQKEKYDQIAKIVHPFAKSLDRITGQLFIPAFADSQIGLVIDAKLTSKQWHQHLPVTDKPFPIIEPALILGVSDAGKLRKAMSEYRTIVNDLISKVHELNPGVPDFQIPEPEAKQVQGGTIYFYPIPGELGLDKQILPNGGLGERVAVISLSESHSKRLLASTRLKAAGGPLGDLNKPIAGAVYFDFKGFIEAATPWLELSLQTAEEHHPQLPGPFTWKDVQTHARAVVDVLKCYRGYSSVTYVEDKAVVTHGEAIFTDLE